MRKDSIQDKIETSPWEAWIVNHLEDSPTKKTTSYDLLLEIAVSSYDLKRKFRGMDFQDVVQFACRWWFKNKAFMKKYDTYARVGALMGGKDHATIHAHVHRRIPTANYDLNTQCIKDFLES